MRSIGPAAVLTSWLTLGWVTWESLRLLLVDSVSGGIVGVWVQGIGIERLGGDFWIEVALPLAFVGATAVLALGIGPLGRRFRAHPVGVAGLAGLAVLIAAAWAGLLTLIFGSHVFLATPSLATLPFFIERGHPMSTWGPWGRVLGDAAVCAAAAGLLTTGPTAAPARRAVLGGLLMLVAEMGWRILVVVTSGQSPMVSRGLGLGGVAVHLLWAGGLLVGLGFVAAFTNAPGAEGPQPRPLLVLLAIAGAGVGLQAALLYSAGFLTTVGLDAQLLLTLPGYDAGLAWFRVLGLVVVVASVGLGIWRMPAPHTATPGGAMHDSRRIRRR